MKKKKILVVDNHPVMLKFMINLLEKKGHQVLTAQDGLSALDILKSYIPDVIFIDLVMPNIGGDKLCQIIRSMPELKDIFLIILSAIAAEGDVDFTEFGANACVVKGPFNKMARNVVTALDQSDLGATCGLSRRIIGLEEIYQREITKELLSSKRHFEVILSNMSEGIIELTLEAKIVYANPTAASIIGVPEEKLLASNFTELFHGAHRKRIKDLLDFTNDKPQIITKKSPIILNGKQVSLCILPVKDKEHKSIIVILNDVSERKQMEAKLQHAQRMESIGTLAGGIAHNFNNLLMSIQGNASLMLLETDSKHPHYRRLKNIEKSVQSGSRLTSQLLGYAKEGRYEISPISLNRLVKETSDTFGITRKEITLHQELAKDVCGIKADQGQIEQVLLNLYVNAADAMPSGGDLILKTVKITHEDMKDKPYEVKSGNYVLLTVRDTGTGMDRKTTGRIFDPFFTTKGLSKGTGLGLASVYGIIKAHGGYIDVESKKGHGTTFKIYLPASDREISDKK